MFSAGLRAKFEAYLNDLKERGVKRTNQSASQDEYNTYKGSEVDFSAKGGTGGTYEDGTTILQTEKIPGSGNLYRRTKTFGSPSNTGVYGGTRFFAGERETSGYNNKDAVEQTRGTNIKASIAADLADEIANMDSHTRGSVLQKLFKDQHTYQEAAKAVDQYKEARTLERSMTVNTWLALVKEIGDKYYSYLPEEGPNNRYEVAQQIMTQDFYAGRNIELYKQELENITKRMQGQHIVEGPQGNDLVTSVEEQLNKQPEVIKAQAEKIPMVPFRNLQADIKAVKDFAHKFLPPYMDPSGLGFVDRTADKFSKWVVSLSSPLYTSKPSGTSRPKGGPKR
jgi:hypothetical protein